MLKHTTPPLTVGNTEQLLLGLVASLKLLLVALAFVVLFVVLFLKSIIGFGMVLLAALNMAFDWLVSFVASVQEVSDFASFLANVG